MASRPRSRINPFGLRTPKLPEEMTKQWEIKKHYFSFNMQMNTLPQTASGSDSTLFFIPVDDGLERFPSQR